MNNPIIDALKSEDMLNREGFLKALTYLQKHDPDVAASLRKEYQPSLSGAAIIASVAAPNVADF